MSFFIFGLLIILSMWVYDDAKERGSSAPIVWAILVFFFVPVFLPLYLICRPSYFKQSLYLCPHCGRFDEAVRDYCPWCRQKIEPWEANPPTHGKKRYQCLNCEKYFTFSVDGYCPHCKEQLRQVRTLND